VVHAAGAVSSQTSAETHRARSPAATIAAVVVVTLTERRSITNIPYKPTIYRKYLLKIHTQVLICKKKIFAFFHVQPVPTRYFVPPPVLYLRNIIVDFRE